MLDQSILTTKMLKPTCSDNLLMVKISKFTDSFITFNLLAFILVLY